MVQASSVLHGFGHMGHLRVLRTRQVCNGARHLQRPVRAPRRPAQAAGRHIEELQRIGVEQYMLVYGLPLQRHIAAALALYRPLPGLVAPRTDAVGGFASRRTQQVGVGQVGHFHMQINAVHQRPAELGLVTVDLVWRAAAGMRRRAQVTTRAGVHGAY